MDIFFFRVADCPAAGRRLLTIESGQMMQSNAWFLVLSSYFYICLSQEHTCSNLFNQSCRLEPWIEIISPSPAQLFVEGSFSKIELRYRVHDYQMGLDSGVANVHIIKHAMSYGGDPFRGREDLKASPHYRIHDDHAEIVLVSSTHDSRTIHTNQIPDSAHV